MTLDDEILAVFHDEVGEHLEALASMLDRDPQQWDLRAAFQLSHNMKGSARMVGAKDVASITHILEDLFSSLRAGLPLKDPVVAMARRGCQLLETCFTDEEIDLVEAIETFQKGVSQLLEDAPEEDASPEEPAPSPAPTSPSTGPEKIEGPAEDEDEESDAEATSLISAEESAGSQESPASPAAPSPSSETVRVATDKLDQLMGLSAEVSINGRAAHRQAKLVRELVQLAYQLSDEFPDLRKAENFRSFLDTARTLNHSVSQSKDRQDKFAHELHEMARQLRMVPLQSLATVFSRVVRQACRVTGKKAEFRLEGGHTELDRGVLDAVRDPVIHLLRNAVAHGIEDEDTRRAADKPAEGRVLLQARSAGAWVELEVCDDGAGVDLNAVRRRGISQKLITAEQADRMSPSQLESLLFEPGFSGAEQVSELSGRGVGLDVVKSNLSELGGKVSLENRPGQGTSFVLRVPLTRLTSKMLHVRLGEHNLLVPMSDVVTTARISNDALQMADGQQVAPVAGEPVAVTSLETLIDVSAVADEVRPGVLMESGGRRRLFLVDQVIGEEELLIQSLRWNLQAFKLYAGCAVLADGQVALVLDVPVLLGGPSGTVDSSWIRGARERARQRRILVVDDSVTSRTLIENILTSAGYAVDVAVDGEQAFERSGEADYDLVITDVEMPRLDGFGLVAKLRATKATARIPIIMVTSLGQDNHKQRAAELGADEYIVKGAFDQDALLGAVGRLL